MRVTTYFKTSKWTVSVHLREGPWYWRPHVHNVAGQWTLHIFDVTINRWSAP